MAARALLARVVRHRSRERAISGKLETKEKKIAAPFRCGGPLSVIEYRFDAKLGKIPLTAADREKQKRTARFV
jgi:hypothetical protein